MERLTEIMPASTGGWMALIALLLALVNLTAAQWGLTPNADPQTLATWRDVIWAALGVHAARRALENRGGGGT